MSKKEKEICDDCEGVANWVRRTQFCGSHYFCNKHAREEENFWFEDPSGGSYYFWEPLDGAKDR